jgi:quercetin dioxygenase-like cupin family protein
MQGAAAKPIARIGTRGLPRWPGACSSTPHPALQMAARSGNDPAPKRNKEECTMALSVRRVVTGHDKNGRAVVKIDEQVKNVISARPGAHASVIWTSEGFPANNDGDADTSTRQTGTTLDNGTVFRVVSFGPGVAGRNHRTDSIDYAAVLSGEIDMDMDGGTVHLKAGDVLVQRGTIHNWVNKGKEPCVIAFTLVAAKPVTVDGKVLNAEG